MFRRTVQDYWLPTPFASFPFTPPPVRYRVPSGSERVIPAYRMLYRHMPEELKLKLNSVALVRERTIPTERPPPVGEVCANFCG